MDLYSAIKPSFCISRLLGLSPYQLLGNIGSREFHKSRPIMAYNLLLLSALIISTILIYNYNIATDFKSIVGSVGVLQFYTDICLAVFVIMTSTLQANKLIKFYKNTNEMDNILSSIDVHISFRNTKILSISQLIIDGIFFFVCISIISYMLWCTEEFEWGMLVICTLTMLPKIINSGLAMNFVDGVMLLKQRYTLVNEKLVEMLHPGNSMYKGLMKQTGVILVRSSKGMSLSTLLERVQSLHYYLCDLAKDINGIYAMQLLFYIATIFVAITVGLTSCFDGLRNVSKNTDELDQSTVAFTLLQLCFVLFFSVQIISIAVSCAYTSTEANKTGVLVHKLLVQTNEEEVKADLEIFSLQLLHRKVQFTACGFFPLDATLLYSIVGGVTTYLVILIQFQLAPGAGETPANKTTSNEIQVNSEAITSNFTSTN